MSLPRCLTCLRASIRAAPTTRSLLPRPSPTSALIPSAHTLHHFAPTPTLSAKANRSAIAAQEAEAFEEFEEENFDEDGISESGDLALPAGGGGSSAGVEKFEKVLAKVRILLELSAFKLRMRIPSPRLLVNLAAYCPPEKLDEVISLWNRWRVEKGLRGHPLVMSSITRALCKVGRPDKALEILGDKFNYGAEIESIRDVDVLFVALSSMARLINTEGAGLTRETRIGQGFSLLALCKYYVPEEAAEDLVGPLCVLAFSLEGGETSSARVEGLIKKLRGVGAEEFVEFVTKLPPGVKKQPLVKRAEIVAKVLHENGREVDAQFFLTVAESIKSEWSGMGPTFAEWKPEWDEEFA